MTGTVTFGIFQKRTFAGILISGMLLFCVSIASGQFYNGTQMTFGKNRIQYKEFLWTYYKFDKFDTYFYLNGRELAVSAAKYALEQIPAMEKRLQINLEDKIQFIIFNNLTDLKQSNIGLMGDEHYNTGGITHIVGGKVFLYFDGSQRNFEKQIRAGIAQVLLNQIFYGSSIGSQIKNNTLFSVPEWYINGLLSYLAEDWSTDINNRVKDGILSGKFDKFNHLTGEEALYAGHSLWKYIADKFGEEALVDILNMSQISRSVESGFVYVIGISFKELVKDWRKYMKELYQTEEEGRSVPDMQILKKARKKQVYSEFKISPDGQNALYAVNEDGRYKVILLNLLTGKKKPVLRGGFRLEEKIDYSYPLISWHPGGRLMAIIVERKGEVCLYFYNLDENSYQKVILYNFEKIVDFTYSPDGRSFILSAVQKGQSDLYLYNIAAGSHQQITSDIYDDLNPVFFDGDRVILFVSNRPSDSLWWDTGEAPASVPGSSDLFIYVMSGQGSGLRRITNTHDANEIQPQSLGHGYFAYLSDDNGICNRYFGQLDSTISFVDTSIHYRYFTTTYPVTNYSRNILEHNAGSPGQISQIIFKDGIYRLQKEELPLSLIPQSVQLVANDYMNQKIRKAKVTEEETRKEELKEAAGEYTKRFRNVYQAKEKLIEPVVKKDQGIDIDNYVFDKQAYLALKPADSTGLQGSGILPGKEPEEDKGFKIPKRLNYRVEYSINQMATQLDFTSLNYFYQPFGGGSSEGFNNLGLNGFFQVGITDLLEDHRIVGGFRIPVNLNNIEYLFTYADLKKRLDKELVFVRQANENEYYIGFYTFIIRYRSYQLYYILKYPVSPAMSFRGTVNVRYQKSTLLSTNEPALKEPDLNEYWGGLKGEVVYDDTKDLGLNLYSGTRFKIFGEYTQILGPEDKNMFVIGMDIRHYLRIHRTFIWANRLAASSSFGKNRLIYYMGGVDNWLSPGFNQETPIDYTMNYAYQTLATNMRGFNQNARNGNNFVVLNSELRFPVFKYFYNRPIRSAFINNFQLITFGDIGTAWAGPDPYSENNSFYIRNIDDGSLHIKIREQKEPLIGGFGFGARTQVFGYFLRADLAWGVEDRVVKKPRFYLSLSLDF